MVGFIPVFKETYPPVVQARQLAHQQQTAPSSFPIKNPRHQERASKTFLDACTRPFYFIFRTRLIPLFTLYTAILNSYLFILLSTLGTTFESVYSFSSGTSGLAYLGMLVGFFASQLTLGFFSDAYCARQARRRLDGVTKPEDRLPPLILGATLLPVGLLMYGWTLEQRTMWLAPVVGVDWLHSLRCSCIFQCRSMLLTFIHCMRRVPRGRCRL